MDKLKVIIRKRALSRMESVFEWYEASMGRKAAEKFAIDIRTTISSISQTPDIGIADDNHPQYLSVLVHPKYRLVYRYTKTTLYIVALRANLMKR